LRLVRGLRQGPRPAATRHADLDRVRPPPLAGAVRRPEGGQGTRPGGERADHGRNRQAPAAARNRDLKAARFCTEGNEGNGDGSGLRGLRFLLCKLTYSSPLALRARLSTTLATARARAAPSRSTAST